MTMKIQSEALEWFAWYPVYVDGKYRWLRYVCRWNTGWLSQIAGRPIWEYCMPRRYYE